MSDDSHDEIDATANEILTSTWNLGQIFRADVHFAFSETDRTVTPDPVILIELTGDESSNSEFLDSRHLPYLALPTSASFVPPVDRWRIVVGVEGQDVRMADAIIELLDPDTAGVALVHVTWLTGIVSSPLTAEGLDNPNASDLLLYRGARPALIDTAQQLELHGFAVSTHLRNAKDPASALLKVVCDAKPNLVVLGLGRHGAGIGHRLQRRVPVPVLYVGAR